MNMNNTFLSKKRIFTLATLLTISIASSQLQAMTTEDSKLVEQATTDIKSLIQEIEVAAKSFADPKDQKPLRAYITEFHNKINFVHSAILVPLSNRINSPELDHNSNFYKVLKATEELLLDINKELVDLHKILINPANLKKAITLANALGKKMDQLATKYELFEQKLLKLNEYLNALDMNELSTEVKNIIALVRKAKIQKALSNAEKAAIVLMLTKKMNN